MRANDATQHISRYLTVMNAQVDLSHLAKRRDGSLRMRDVELGTSASALAAHPREVGGYCRSDRDPADEESRDVERGRRCASKLSPLEASIELEVDEDGEDAVAVAWRRQKP